MSRVLIFALGGLTGGLAILAAAAYLVHRYDPLVDEIRSNKRAQTCANPYPRPM